jgi:hypothetical protein
LAAASRILLGGGLGRTTANAAVSKPKLYSRKVATNLRFISSLSTKDRLAHGWRERPVCGLDPGSCGDESD